MLSHYGTEYYCPVSLFRVFGVSEFEVIDSMEDGSEDIEDEQLEIVPESKEVKDNMKGEVLMLLYRKILDNLSGKIIILGLDWRYQMFM